MVAHGKDGWELEDYDWSEVTGVGTYTYSRVRKDTGEEQLKVIEKQQPTCRKHAGWRTRL